MNIYIKSFYLQIQYIFTVLSIVVTYYFIVISHKVSSIQSGIQSVMSFNILGIFRRTFILEEKISIKEDGRLKVFFISFISHFP